RGNRPKVFVARCMAVGVIHTLEVVDINDEQAETGAGNDVARIFDLCPVVKMATIRDIGQRVGAAQVFEALFLFFEYTLFVLEFFAASFEPTQLPTVPPK